MKLRLFFVTIYALVVCVMYPVSVFAVPEIILVKNKSGNPVFSMQIYGTNEPAHDWYHSDIAYTAEQKKAIERAGIFWMERLKPTGSLPEPVRWSWAQKNELDGSGYLYDIGGLTSSVQGATVPGGTVEPGALALLSYGILSSFPDHPHGQTVLLPVWNTYSSLQERINKRNIELTMMHEMGHALAFTRLIRNLFEKKIATVDGLKYFIGSNAAQVFGDGKSQRPIRLESTGSHFQVADSLMNMPLYYSTLMEFELAAMIDSGYNDIKLRDFYGRSIFTDNNTGTGQIINTTGYSKLNSQGQYTSQANENTYGIGLHVFGKNNTVIQRGNILTSGTAAVGIRNDGENNTLVVSPGIVVSSTGHDGVGILLVNSMGTKLDINGTVKGKGASIYFNTGSRYTLNVMKGAHIEGDIVTSAKSTGTITFGTKADNLGRSIAGQADSNFNFTLSGKILTPYAVTSMLGGTTTFLNRVESISVTVAEQAKLILSGNAVLDCNTLTNHGELTLADSATVARDVQNNGKLIIAKNVDYTFPTKINGAGPMFKFGAGKLIIDKYSTRTGTTDIFGGSIELRDFHGLGSGNIAVNPDTYLYLNSTNTYFKNNIFGGGTVVKLGKNSVTMAGQSAFGKLVVDQGTLIVGDKNNRGFANVYAAVEVNSGATLRGFGHAGRPEGTVTINSGGTLAPGDNDTPGNLAVRNLVLKAGSRSKFRLNVPNNAAHIDNDVVYIGGNLTLGGTLEARAKAAGIYGLFCYTGSVSGKFSSYDVKAAEGSSFKYGSYKFISVPEWVGLEILGLGQSYMMAWNAVDGLFSNTSGGSGVWGGGSNWTTLSGENGQNQNLAESVGVFAGKKGTVTVKETQPFDTLQFKTDGYVLDEGQLAIAPAEGNTGVLNVDSKVTASIRSIITGEGKNLEKTGAGELELFAENQYTGDTFINGGTLAVNSDSSFGSPDGSIIINGGILKTGVGFKSKRAITLGEHDGGIESSSGTELVISGQVTGSGTLFKYGPGTLELTNPGNDYQGGTTIDQGLFRLTDSGAAGFGDIFLNSGAGIEMRLDGNSSMGNQIDGYGTIEKSGTGNLSLTAESIRSDALKVTQGSLSIKNVLETEQIHLLSNTSLDVGTLRIADQTHLQISNQGRFGFRKMQVIGTDNRISGNMPSAAGKELYFILSPFTLSGDTMLRVDGRSLNVDGASLTLASLGPLKYLSKGDTFTLIDRTSGLISRLDEEQTVEYGAFSYLFSVEQKSLENEPTVKESSNDNEPETPLTLTLQSSSLTGGSDGAAKAYLESSLAGLHTVALGGRFVATTGIGEAVKATRGPSEGRTGFAISAAFTAGYQEINSGSKIEGENYNAMSAFTWRIDNRYGSTRIGVFAEGGWGDYDTRNGFAARSIKGDSDIDYAGGGIFARHDFTNGIYTEGSFRIGNVRGDFSSSDIGNGAAFDSKMTYWGSHIGFGYIHAFSEVDSLDTYAKLYWTRQGSDSVTTDAKERLRLDSADSLTTHLGARYTHEFNNDLGFHFGLAWEHEYEGEQTGSLDGLDIGSPDMGGDSGIAEIGLRWKPERTGWSFDLTAHGGLGVRDSIGGTINIAYEF